ncbi:peptidoglycan D,D-transpeptidase FtsI family protein [Kutzneria sp. CA-103260]|uniref:peptidoglycan D,D-transpeptidase FtsI family protein n=1 Tax=Kutzneria sp. CA-103260 TaxID=2802641 RepID=UPI001BA58B26|nr:penicillin-binding protein 2 [Kutzneria sp. CA-103260]QUQ71691.1 cell division protein FtsI [Kutzneria sp. CA-103260]
MPANRTTGGRPATRPRPVVRSGGPAPRPAGRKSRLGAPAGVGNHPKRIVLSRLLMVAVLVIAGVRLVQVQGVQAAELSAAAERQRATLTTTQALRGQILDRNGTQLAFSVETRLLSIDPKQLKANWDDPKNAAFYKELGHGDTYDAYTQGMADFIHQQVGDQTTTADLLTKIRSAAKPYVELTTQATPVEATAITKRYAEITPIAQQQRVYPDGAVGSNIVGYAQWGVDAKAPVGLAGLENSLDDTLKGTNGVSTVDTANNNNDLQLPGTVRDSTPAVPGSNVQLTIDADVQYQAQQMLDSYQKASGAADASMVVMDAKTGELYAMAVTNGFNPNKFNDVTSNDQLGNAAVSTPFEPGSVGKVVTAAGAIEYGVEQPDSVIDVPASFKLADRTVTDAWAHGDVKMTMAGVIAKSSNIGTLEVAQKIGEDRFVDLLTKFGLGQKTGVGLPGESGGSVPPRSTWSGSTFANLPIGQGLSMTLLQMTGMYQAIANDGVRVPPRIIKSVTKPDGTVVPTPKPDPVPVVSPQTAKTVRDMMRAVMQKDPKDYLQNGTGYPAALAGYQLSGKTGTAQQPDPALGGAYSQTKYWITFAGILPADNPRLVVGIMLDKPTYGLQAGTSAAPLFHQFGTYLVQHFQIPMSATPAPVVQLQLP